MAVLCGILTIILQQLAGYFTGRMVRLRGWGVEKNPVASFMYRRLGLRRGRLLITGVFCAGLMVCWATAPSMEEAILTSSSLSIICFGYFAGDALNDFISLRAAEKSI